MANNDEMIIKIGASIEELKKAMEEAKKIIVNFADTLSKGIKISIDTKSLKNDVNKAIKDFNDEIDDSNKKNKKLKIDVDVDKVKSNIKKAVREAITQINREGINDRKVHIKTSIDNSSINMSLSNLKKKLANQEIRVNTGKAEGDIIRLSTYMNQLASKKVTPQIDTSKAEQAKLSIAELATYMNQLQSKKIKIDISFANKDIVNNLKDIDSLLKSIQKNSNIKLNVNATGRAGGGGGVQSQLQQYRTLRQEARHFALEAEKAWTAGNKQGFEQNRQNFLVAMKDLADFSRQLGNLSASREAGMYSNMLRSLQQTSPLYNDILNKIKQLKKEQKDFNDLISDGNKKLKQDTPRRTKDNRPGFTQGTVGASAYVIHYLGRSSKGFGSFGEATSQLITDINSLGGSMSKLMVPVAALAGTIAITVTAFTAAIKGIEFFGGLLKQIGQEVYNALKPGIELYKQQTSAFFSFTASFMSNGLIGDKKLSTMGSEGRDIASGLSVKLLKQAQIDAETSAFSLQDILASLQGTLPILMSHGMTADQAYEINKGVAAVAKMIQLTPSQILQETRDLAQGSITSRGSQVANALGITNADLKKYEGDAEGLYRFLIGKFEQYKDLLTEFEDTALGRWQQFQERWQTVARNIVEGTLPQFKGLFEGLIEYTGEWQSKYIDQAGNENLAKLNAMTGKWQDAVTGMELPDFKPSDAFFKLSEPFEKIQKILPEIVKHLAETIDEIIQFIEEETGISDPIELAKQAIDFLIDGFKLSVEVLVELISTLESIENILKTFEPILVPIINVIRSMGNGFLFVVSCVNALISGVRLAVATVRELWNAVWNENDAWAKAQQKEALDSYIASGSKVGKSFEDWMNMEYYDSYDSMFKSLGQRKNKKFTTFEDFISKYASGELNVKSTDKNLGNLRGESKSTDDDKARKQAIKDAQRDMKEHIKGLKEALKDHIAELKDALNENKIAFDEGFMSMKNYYEQKANIEAEEARARLAEAQEEREWILKTPYEHEADQLKALHTVDREIRQYTRELGKATRAQQEVARNTQKFLEAQQAVTNFMSGKGGTAISGQFINAKSYDSLMSFNPQTLEDKIAWAVQMAMQQGFDKDSAAAMVGNWIYESGGQLNPNAIGDNGTSYGIAQWHNERWQGLLEWAKENNSDASDFRTQVLFALHEIISGREKGNFYANNGSLTQQVRNYMNNVERPSAEARISTFQERLDGANKAYYLASKQLVQASGNLKEASNSLVSASGEMIGYTPEAQYSRAGMDTRYSAFQDMSSGVETQISGLNENVKAIFNLFAKKYYEKTGEKVLWTSFTGDMRNGGANNPHSASEKGHRYGWKGDLWVSNNKIASEIAKEIGLALGDEDDHLDLSAWGGVGGRALTDNIDAESLHTRILEAKQAIATIANTDMPDFISSVQEFREIVGIINEKAPMLGVMFSYTPNTTETGHEAYKNMQDYLDAYVGKINDNQSRVTGNLKAQLMKLMPQLIQDVKKYRTDPQMLEQVFIDFKNKTRDVITSFAKDMTDYNLKVMERNAEYRGTDLLSGRYSFRDLVTKYNSYMTDLTNSLGLGRFIEMLEKNYVELEANGFTKDAFEIKEYIDSLKQRLINLQKSWIEKIGDFYDKQQNIFDATEGFTDLQREFGTREIKAYKAQAEYEAYSIMLAQVNNELNETNQKLAKSQSLMKSLAENTKEWKEEQSKVNVLSADKSRLETLQLEYEYQKKINDLQRKQPEYMRDLRNAALQGLENGLVTFLTDGITEAESLKDALLDLAKTFLKEIQQVSAKWLVKSLMTKITGQFEIPTPPSVDSTNVANAVTTGSMAVVEAIHGLQYALTGTGQYSQGLRSDFVKANLTKGLNQPYQNSFTLSALQNSQFGANGGQENKYTFDANKYKFNSYISNNSGLQAFDQALQTSAQSSIPNFSQGLESISTTTTTSSVEKLGISMQTASTTIESSIQRVATYISGQLMTALTQLANGAQNAANMLSMLSGAGSGTGHATGGYISGPGTSTSDSIPAMLSNGEFVLRSDAVRRYGINFLNALNEGKLSKIKSSIPHFANGGVVQNIAQDGTARGISNFGKNMASSINNVNNISVALVRDEQEGMRQLLKSAEGERILMDFNRKYAKFTSRL